MTRRQRQQRVEVPPDLLTLRLERRQVLVEEAPPSDQQYAEAVAPWTPVWVR